MISFDTFLDAYPIGHRRGAPAAKRTWDRLNAINDISRMVYNQMLAWKSSRDWEKDDGSMIPTIQNFLDREQWVDSPQHPGPKADTRTREQILAETRALVKSALEEN